SERLVIMVTHNPELAEQYSTRIIRLLDGEVIADTNPFTESEEQEKSETAGGVPTDFDENAQKTETVKDEKVKKKSRAKMGLWTTFRLSAQNLFTKKARTAMTAIAGAIGIIGVSMVLALSSGLQNYINTMQNDMLSGNPIMVQETAFDLNSLMQATAPSDKKQIAQEFGYVNVNSMIENLIAKSNVAESLMIKNTITKEYVDYLKAMPSDHTASIFFDYGLDVANNIYTDFAKTRKSDGSLEVLSTTSLSAIRSQYIGILKKTNFKQYATYVTTVVDNFKQSPASEDYILQQYDLKDGRVATQANELMIVIDDKSELTDILLAQLGYYSQDEFMNLVYRGAKDQDETMEGLYDETLDRDRFTYSELMGKKFTYFPNNTAFNKNTVDMGGQSVTTVTYNPHYKTEWGAGYELEIVGILQPKASVSYGSLKSGFYYTEEFRKKFIADNINSEIVEYYKSQNQSSVSSGWVQVNMGGTPTTMPMGITYPIEFTYYNEDFTAEQTYNETAFVGTPSSIGALMGLAGSMMGGGSGGSSTTSASEFYIYTIQQMGGIDMPNKISVYPPDFESKQRALNYLDAWNGDGDITVNGSVISKDDRQDIVYSDALSVIVDMLNQLINIITIVLVGFTSLSLVVSSVMIAIITYVSVVERTKEIGVIRSLGGRKKDVSRLFTAETAIIGITSGAFGIGVTYGLSAIVNIIVSSLTPLSAIATLPWWQALIMIGVSTLLTLVSGVFPARSAAKKDPVVALRTE
ncbi:MAG: FtsX-like permease family protein, partial [Clostridia bacterium]|nr:FtsX-like permease family protein [Clostridia bacterium]